MNNKNTSHRSVDTLPTKVESTLLTSSEVNSTRRNRYRYFYWKLLILQRIASFINSCIFWISWRYTKLSLRTCPFTIYSGNAKNV